MLIACAAALDSRELWDLYEDRITEMFAAALAEQGVSAFSITEPVFVEADKHYPEEGLGAHWRIEALGETD